MNTRRLAAVRRLGSAPRAIVRWAWAILCCVAALQTQATTSVRELTHELILDNGMTVLLVQRPGQPMVSAGWVARVGSANESPGMTGISHLFEHMMFKGSPRIGTRDPALDESLRLELDDVRSAMFDEERRLREQVRLGQAESLDAAAAQSEVMAKLESRFAALLERQRANLVKDEFDLIYTRAGATGLNAFTNQDMTAYFVRVPANKLELWFWMESERLLDPVFREFYAERDVVFEERRLRTESTPTGRQDEAFNALFWRGHPYAWPVVGWPSDIDAITREQAEAYFDLHYAPGNITAAIVGDFEIDAVEQLAERYFGRIPAGRELPPDVITLATPLEGVLTYEATVEAPPSATISWRTTAFGGVDDPALQVLASVLSGKTGRLYQRLVLDEQLATSVDASADALKYDGSFSVSAAGKQGVDPRQLETLLLEEIDRIVHDGISQRELTRVKNQLAASRYRRLEDPFFLMVQLLYFEGLRDWTSMDSYFARIAAVDADQVQQVARRYLDESVRATQLYSRAAAEASP